MGLFTSNKKLCPVCGSPTPRLLPTKIEGDPICKACDRKIFLPDGAVNGMTLQQFKEYLAFYEGNAALRESFQETERIDAGKVGLTLQVDTVHELFRLTGNPDDLVFETSCFQTLRFSADRQPLIEVNRDGLRFYETDIPDQVYAMQDRIDRYNQEQREYERLKQMQEMVEQHAKEHGQTTSSRYIAEPRFDAQIPFQKFYLDIEMEHPYWRQLHKEWKGPSFSAYRPSVSEYLRDYQNDLEIVEALARRFVLFINEGAPEIRVPLQAAADFAASGTQAAQAVQPPVDAVAEIQRYKGLLDAGVITEEEFTAKKRQLLGI